MIDTDLACRYFLRFRILKIAYDRTQFKLRRVPAEKFSGYLEFNITRHKRIAKLAGTSIRALIAEVIYWHKLLILAEKGTGEPFDTVRAEIAKTGKETLERYLDSKKLSISLIGSMTGLPFETIRRQFRAMEVAGLIQQSEAYGLLINKESEFHQKVSGELVHFEQEQIVKLIQRP